MSIIYTDDTTLMIEPNDLGGAELRLASGLNHLSTHFSPDQFHRFVWECAGVLDQITPKEEATIPPTTRYCTSCSHELENGLCPICEADLFDLPLGGDLCG